MPNTNDLFKGAVGQAFKSGIDSIDGKNQSALFRLILALMAVLIFVGAEAVRIVFRKNFWVTGKDLACNILCFICFIGIAIASFDISNDNGMTKFMSISDVVSAILLIVFAIFILIKGISYRIKTVRLQVAKYSKGESVVLGFLKKDNWSNSLIRNFAEPLTVLSFGVFICAFNLLIGLAFIICAVSYWIHLLVDTIMGNNNLEQTAVKLNTEINQQNRQNIVRKINPNL